MSDDELPTGEQFVQDVQEIVNLDRQVAVQSQELADAEKEMELTSAKIHFMDMFEAHMAECRDKNCVIKKVVGFDLGPEDNDGWVERVLSNLSRYFQGEEISSDSDHETSSEEGNL